MMQKLTLLDIVQDIMSGLDMDEVNSIEDTTESLQVAQIVKDSFSHIIDGRDWPHLYQMFQLDSSTDTAMPTHMKLPEDVVEVLWVKYNKRKSTDTTDKYLDVTYKTPEEFLNYCNQRRSDSDNVVTVTDFSEVPLYILEDVAPTYFTSFDDAYIVFDSYDSDVDSILQNSKTQCYGKRLPSFEMEDDFVPDLPAQAFSLLLAESKKHASASLKQMADSTAQEYAITQRRRMSQKAWNLNGGVRIPNYGRKR